MDSATANGHQNDNEIILIDAGKDSLTITWPEVTDAIRYVLEYRKHSGGSPEKKWEVLSDKLTTCQVQKMNLDSNNKHGYYFRVGAIVSEIEHRPLEWITHLQPFQLLDGSQFQMDPPNVIPDNTKEGIDNYSLDISWKLTNMKGCMAGYELQMREYYAGKSWITIARYLSSSSVTKKNCNSFHGYQFRIRPVRKESIYDDDGNILPQNSTIGKRKSKNTISGINTDRPFSKPSIPMLAIRAAKQQQPQIS